MVTGLSVFNYHFSTSKDYDGIACNRSSVPSGHWATVAADILTKEMI